MKDWIKNISDIVQGIAGIQLGVKQESMVRSRLTKRFLDLGLLSPEQYIEYLKEHREEEVTALISLLTTHHTYFFREFAHFEFLEQKFLPALISKARSSGQKTVSVWCAAASRGQEVYSLAMFLNLHLSRFAPEISYEILGTDIDSESISIAKNGVYKWDEIKEIPNIYIQGNWARGTGEIAAFVKAKDRIKQKCHFAVMNLLEIPSSFAQKFDVIFCRNVFIYFQKDQIRKITTDLMSHLNPEGALISGLSESLNGLDLPIELIGPSAYVRKTKEKSAVVSVKNPTKSTNLGLEKPIRVLCVDDSSTILTLMKKIFSKEEGFELVGTAQNGLEATNAVEKLKPDIVTLDIHMPIQNGVEYLEKNISLSHPPVIVVSSVSREDAGLAIKAIELGAKDYVEKPALSNMAEKADEIRNKVRCAFRMKSDVIKTDNSVAKSFSHKNVPSSPETQARVIIAGPADLQKVEQVLNAFEAPHPPTIIIFSGGDTLAPALFKQLRTGAWAQTQFAETPLLALAKETLYCCGLKAAPAIFGPALKGKQAVRLLLGDVSESLYGSLKNLGTDNLIIEDFGVPGSRWQKELIKIAKYFVPVSSVSWHVDEMLSKAA